jgi:hypothetical protein
MPARPTPRTALRVVRPASPAPGGIADYAAAAPAAREQAAREQVADRREPGVSTRPPGPGSRAQRPCRCGHQREAHQHYRNGTDCGTCGCGRFSAAPGRLATLVGAVLHRRPARP